MSSKKLSAIRLLSQKFEGNERKMESKTSRIFRSTSRENPVTVDTDFRSGFKPENSLTMHSSTVHQFVSSQRTESQRSPVIYENTGFSQRTSVLEKRSVKNISFSFPPANAIYGTTVSA